MRERSGKLKANRPLRFKRTNDLTLFKQPDRLQRIRLTFSWQTSKRILLGENYEIIYWKSILNQKVKLTIKP